MQKRSFLLLLGTTVAVVAAMVAALSHGDRAVSPSPVNVRVFPKLGAHLGDLAWLRLSHGAMTADFTAIGGHWVVVEKGNYPAAPGRMRRLLLGLADLTLVEPKTRRPALFARLDLDEPTNGKSTLVSLQDRTGATVAELIVGKSRPDRLGGGNDGVYVRRPGEELAWLARGSLDLPSDITDWLDRRILDIAPARVASIALTGADGAVLTLRRDAAGGKVAVADPPADAKLKGQAALAAPAGALAGLDLDDVKPAADLPVPDSGVAVAAFQTFDGVSVTLRLFRQGGRDWVAVAASGSGKAAAEASAINRRLARWRYAIGGERAKLLRTALADLVEPAKGS